VKFTFKIVEIGETPGFFSIVEIRTILLTRKEFIINIRPKRDDGDHVLILTIDADLEGGLTIRANFFFDPSRNHKALELSLPFESARESAMDSPSPFANAVCDCVPHCAGVNNRGLTIE
jgi:hypothetical protein